MKLFQHIVTDTQRPIEITHDPYFVSVAQDCPQRDSHTVY
jgi:hypothetical protein